MTQREVKRVEIVAKLAAAVLTTGQASQLPGLSARQVKRLRKAYREKGAVARGTWLRQRGDNPLRPVWRAPRLGGLFPA